MRNSNTKIFFITGGSGFVGWHLCNFLKDKYWINAGYNCHPCRINGCRSLKVDITKRAQVLKTVELMQPTIIIHTAACSSPDQCETDQARAWAINVEGTQNIVDAANKCGSRIVFISTDLIFDGKVGNYAETNTPRAINYYGETKLEAEKVCLQSASDSLVVRIALQYGWGNGNTSSFTDWLMQSLKADQTVTLFSDQYRTPLYVMDTCIGLEIAAINGTSKEIYHLTGPERINRYEFGLAFAALFKFSDSLLKASLMRDVPSLAPRPEDVSLNGQKFFNHFKFRPRGIKEGLEAMARIACQR